MEDFGRRSYPYLYPYEPCSSSYSQAAAWLSHYNHGNIDSNEDIQIGMPTKSIKFVEPGICIDDDTPAAVIFDALSTKWPHDSGLLGTDSLGPVMQLDETVQKACSSAITQSWQNFVVDNGHPAPTLTCNSPENYLLNSRNPLPPPTRSHRRKKAIAGGGNHDREASRERIGNGHVQKLVEKHRRNKMKALCSTLLSLIPEEFHKTKYALSDKLLEAIKHIRHLQDKLIELEKKTDQLNFSATIKPFSNRSCVYQNLQASQFRPSNVRDKFQTIRVSKFGPGIQVTVDTFSHQIDLSSLLMVLEEAGAEVVSATVSAVNDRAFYSIQSKFSDFRHFDSAVLHGRIEQLIDGKLPLKSMTK